MGFFFCSSELDLVGDVLLRAVSDRVWRLPSIHELQLEGAHGSIPACGVCVALSHTKRWSGPGAATVFRKEKSENLMTTVVLLCLQTIWKMRTGYKYLTNENWKESSG